jgi:hypothetical protein
VTGIHGDPLHILVTGSRHRGFSRADRGLIRVALIEVHHDIATAWPPGTVPKLIHGGCRGTDLGAKAAAISLGWDHQAFDVDWEAERRRRADWRRAGPERNQRMVDEAHPAVCVAFPWGDNPRSGTADCVRKALAAEVPVRKYYYPDLPEGGT